MNELSLLTWNIDQWPNRLTVARDRRRLEQVERAIAGFDVVCLQECWSSPAQQIRHAFPSHYLDDNRSRIGFGSGLLTLSRHPIRYGRCDRFRNAAVPDSLAAKGMTLARLDVPGFGEIDVVNTHLQARRFPGVRLRQVEELGRFVQENTGDAVTVMAGDLNAPRQSPEFERLQERLHFREVLEERPLDGTAAGATRFTGDADRIDHLLLMPSESDAVELIETGAIDDDPDVSDHRGLFVKMRFNHDARC